MLTCLRNELCPLEVGQSRHDDDLQEQVDLTETGRLREVKGQQDQADDGPDPVS